MVVYKPRDHQAKARRDLWAFLTGFDGDPLINIPTGGGKSLVIAFACEDLQKVGRKAVILAPKRELVSQNLEKFEAVCGSEKSGVYCAGLNRKEPEADFVFGTIQSCYKNATELGFRHCIIVDEAHLIRPGDDGMFNKMINDLRVINPNLRVIGLTATEYRLDSGLIYGKNKKLPFDAMCHQTSIPELLDKGYLSPIKAVSVSEVDVSNVRIVRGDFDMRTMEAAYKTDVARAAAETVAAANKYDRKSCLVFGCTIDHCEMIAAAIRDISGEEVGMVSGETPSLLRKSMLDRFKAGDLRWLVNCDVLTVGFDAPIVDAVAVLRSTMSPGLFYQIVGRAFRPAEGKEYAILLDFGGNLKRHGALDSKKYGRLSTKQQAAELAGEEDPDSVRECPSCKRPVMKGDTICIHCGAELVIEREPNHDDRADSVSVALECVTKPLPRMLTVERVQYALHKKKGASEKDPRTLRVDYLCRKVTDGVADIGIEKHSEWICLEHKGWARQNAVRWWMKRCNVAAPEKIEDALDIANQGLLASATEIEIKRDGSYDKVIDVRLGPMPDTTKGTAEQEVLPF